MAMVCSAVLSVLPAGVFITTMPSRVAARRVDVVGADAGPHDGLEPVVAFQGLGGDFDAAAADGAVELGQGRAEGVAFQAGADFVLDARGFGQQIEPFLGQRVENDNFGHGSVCKCLIKVQTDEPQTESLAKCSPGRQGAGQIYADRPLPMLAPR